jgi:hypothetical protein
VADQALFNAIDAVKATAPKYLKGATDLTIRRRLLLKILQQSGNIMFNIKAPEMIWQVEVREPQARVLTGGQLHQWDTFDPYESLRISHAELEVTDVLRRRSQMINSDSPQQIVDLAGTKMEQLLKKMTRTISKQFYADNTSGTSVGQMTGIRSIMKPAALPSSAALVAIPASGSTYGGQPLTLNPFGGRWSTDLATKPNATLGTDWPFGSGSPEYDPFSPKMFNTAATYDSDTGWKANCLKILRRSAACVLSTGGESVTPVVHILALDMLNEYKDKLETRERLLTSDYAKSLGFPDTMVYEGAIVTTDFDCPAGTAYSINPSEMALYSCHNNLFFTDGPEWQQPEQATLFLVGFMGNWRWNPKHFCEMKVYPTS